MKHSKVTSYNVPNHLYPLVCLFSLNIAPFYSCIRTICCFALMWICDFCPIWTKSVLVSWLSVEERLPHIHLGCLLIKKQCLMSTRSSIYAPFQRNSLLSLAYLLFPRACFLVTCLTFLTRSGSVHQFKFLPPIEQKATKKLNQQCNELKSAKGKEP